MKFTRSLVVLTAAVLTVPAVFAQGAGSQPLRLKVRHVPRG